MDITCERELEEGTFIKTEIFSFHSPYFLTSLWCIFFQICHLSITTMLQALYLWWALSACRLQNIYYQVLEVKFAIRVCTEFYVYIYGQSYDGVKCFRLTRSLHCANLGWTRLSKVWHVWNKVLFPTSLRGCFACRDLWSGIAVKMTFFVLKIIGLSLWGCCFVWWLVHCLQ